MSTPSQRTARQAAMLGALGLGAAVLASARPAEAAPAIPIGSCPYTAAQPGTYVLIRDLTCPGPAITITADNVRLNLGGRTLTAIDPGAEPNTGDGIVARGTASDPITGLQITNGTVAGFREEGGSSATRTAIDLLFTSGARITGVTLRENSDGIIAFVSPELRVVGVTASDNNSDGIIMGGSPGARLTGNVVSGGEGIDVTRSDGAQIVGNRVSGSRLEGIRVGGITSDPITGVRITGNTSIDNDISGIALILGEDGVIGGNTTTGNDRTGITVLGEGNVIQGNRATGNGETDLNDANLPACLNTWRGNRFVTDNENNGPSTGCIG